MGVRVRTQTWDTNHLSGTRFIHAMNFPIVSFLEAVLCAWLVYVCEKETAFLDQKTALCLIAAERLRSRADHQEAVLLPISWYKL